MRFARRPRRTDHRVIHLAASMCLAFPDDRLYSRADLLRAGLDEQPPGPAVDELRAFLPYLGTADLPQHYVDVFDLSGRQTLYLSYWSDGDTRRRGETLTEFKRVYRESGFLVDLDGELPDHLPIVLEFAARVDPERGLGLLAEHRGALELIRFALLDAGSPYVHVLAAVCATLPGQSPPDRTAARAMSPRGPEVETVGLDPFDPRLLPLHTGTEATR